MLRLLPLLAFALLPAAIAAPVPPGGRVEYGASGVLTRADLEKIKFDSRLVMDAEDFVERKPANEVRPKNRYDVAVHMPWTKFRAGEPIPAYFALRNNRGYPLRLDARLSLSGPEPTTWNSCDIRVRDT